MADTSPNPDPTSPTSPANPTSGGGGRSGGGTHRGRARTWTGEHRKSPSLRSLLSAKDVPSLPSLVGIGGAGRKKEEEAAAAGGGGEVAIASDVIPSLRSSEQDPTPHQMEIPDVAQVLRHVRLCAALDAYRRVDQNFDYEFLAGKSRASLEALVRYFRKGGKGAGGEGAGGTTDLLDDIDFLRANLQPVHREILTAVLECGEDVVVEGFLHETGGRARGGDAEDDTGTQRDKAPDDRVEAVVYSSSQHRQFVVAWQGPIDDQAKPVRKTIFNSARNVVHLSPNEPVAVIPAYRDAYFRPGVEDRVFALLDDLADRTPFCDVVMTGHSFGAALATLAAARYASSRPQIRVICDIMGSPRVGGVEFRHWVNSLPNLRIARLENAGDAWVNSPEGPNWSHVGHSFVMHDGKVLPYRFDHGRPTSGSKFLKAMTITVKTTGKNDPSSLATYVAAVDNLAKQKQPWASDFVGEDGDGVVGKEDKEKKLMV